MSTTATLGSNWNRIVVMRKQNNFRCLLLFACLAASAAPALASKLPDAIIARPGGMDNYRKPVEGVNMLGGGGGKVDPNAGNRQQLVGTTDSASANALQTRYAHEAKVAYDQAVAAEKKGNVNEAIVYFQKSVNLRDLHFRNTDQEIGKIQEHLGDLFLAQNKDDDALHAYLACMGGYARTYGPGSRHRIKPLVETGKLYLKKNDARSAYTSFNQAYLLTKRDKGNNSPETMKIRLLLASSARAIGANTNAVELYKEAIAAYDADGSLLNKEQLLATLDQYVAVLRAANREDDAKLILARAEGLKNPGVAGGEAPAVPGTEPPTQTK